MRVARRLAAALLGACALAAVGCSESLDQAPTRQVLSTDQVEAAPAGSPERAVLVWWRAIQRSDTEEVFGSLTRSARSDLEQRRVASDIREGLGPWSVRVTPEIVHVERTRRGVTVYMRLDLREPIGSGVWKPGAQLLALPLRAVRGSWRIDNSVWLRDQAERYAAE